MKSRSSIFSFDTLTFPFSEILKSRVLGIVVVFVVGIEIALRVIVPAGFSPGGSWHNAEMRDQVRQLEELDTVDVYFTGSSISAVNIAPLSFDEGLATAGNRSVSFNAGIRGCSYTCIEQGFMELYWARKISDTVILVVGPADINEAHDFGKKRSRQFMDTFDRKPLDKWFLETFRHIWLFGFRAEIKDFLKKQKWVAEPSRVAERGHVPVDEKQRRYSHEFQFDENGELFQALTRLTTILHAQGTRVVLLEGLSDSITWADVGADGRENYLSLMNALAGRTGIPFVRIDEIRPADESYVDDIHINSAAAREFSRNLASLLIGKGVFHTNY